MSSIDFKHFLVKTLVYSDIFDFPLTKEEAWQFLISSKKTDRNLMNQTLVSHLSSGKLIFKSGFYCLKGREEIIKKRIRREKESLNKLKLAQKIVSKLSFIPTVQLIAVSGGLSMKNSDEDDDIDLFVITKKNTLWITRLILLSLLEILRVRRKRNDENVKNKICLNFLVDESAVSFEKNRQDLYNAHEIIQMMPFYERNNMYNFFLSANEWVKKFMFNGYEHRTTHPPATLCVAMRAGNRTQNNTESLLSLVLFSFLGISFIEWAAKKMQLFYMGGDINKEKISNRVLAFHPLNYRNKILGIYKKKLKEYGVKK